MSRSIVTRAAGAFIAVAAMMASLPSQAGTIVYGNLGASGTSGTKRTLVGSLGRVKSRTRRFTYPCATPCMPLSSIRSPEMN